MEFQDRNKYGSAFLSIHLKVPFHRHDPKSLGKLIGILGSEKGKVVDDVITMLRNKKLLGTPYCLNAWEYCALKNGLKKRFPDSYNEEQDQIIFRHLTYNPGPTICHLYLLRISDLMRCDLAKEPKN